AAARLAAEIKAPVVAVHHALEFDEASGRSGRSSKQPLEADFVIVLHAHLLSTPLASRLLSAIPTSTQVLLAGDPDSLSGSGPGTVLSDILESQLAPVTRLKSAKSANSSLIVRNAHRIAAGAFPRLVRPGDADVDCYLVERASPEEINRVIVRLVAATLPNKFGLDPLSDIAVLAPMNRGAFGVAALNTSLRQALNPLHGQFDTPTEDGTPIRFRVGDKVVQSRNVRHRRISHADTGFVAAVSSEAKTLTVDFGGARCTLTIDELRALDHGYAASVHSVQGRVFPAVVIPVHHQHYPMLSRQLLYTALAAASRLCVFVGTRQAVAMAVRRTLPSQQISRLKDRLAILDSDLQSA
ncbi:MAG TPA: ATP-binding domain-containing protein, partial [Blastocatellia bacterium]|nr:ATP-binding domain-containing protein [Blastocatellia bacterium]